MNPANGRPERPGNGDCSAPVAIIGAGPAGLAAALELSKYGVQCLLLDADSNVGGLARTFEYKGYLFDIGGHRFFTNSVLVKQMWHEILGPDLLVRPRLSRIYYRSKFFRYPLDPLNAVRGLGILEALACGASYTKSRLFPASPEPDFETWISNRFGKRLFRTFFESYTEKVWGMPCRDIRAEWAAQRIQGLSLRSLVWNAVGRRNGNGHPEIRTLVNEFYYPRRGPGMMWTKARELVEAAGCQVILRAPVDKICWEHGRVTAIRAGGRWCYAKHFISTMPLRDFISSLDPDPGPLSRAGNDFHYRDFLTVALIVRGGNLFPDNWIYVHDPAVRVGRIQNYKNWSPDMVPNHETTCLGLEYFCSECDALWQLSDEELIRLGRDELGRLGLVKPSAVIDGTVLRVKKAYPVYDEHYQRGLAAVREFLATIPNLQVAGRNGMHRYNNQDHSMLTGILAARNILGARYDLWQVNEKAAYHEDASITSELDAICSTQPAVPGRVAASGSGR
jgi:protoporphyrinogen oxidase